MIEKISELPTCSPTPTFSLTVSCSEADEEDYRVSNYLSILRYKLGTFFINLGTFIIYGKEE